MGSYWQFCLLIERSAWPSIARSLPKECISSFSGSLNEFLLPEEKFSRILKRIESLEDLVQAYQIYDEKILLPKEKMVFNWHFQFRNTALASPIYVAAVNLQAPVQKLSKFIALKFDFPWPNKNPYLVILPRALRNAFMEIVALFRPTLGFLYIDYAYPLEDKHFLDLGSARKNTLQIMRLFCEGKEYHDVRTFAVAAEIFPFENFEFAEVTTIGETRFISETRGFGNELRFLNAPDPEKPLELFDKYRRHREEMLSRSQQAAAEILVALDLLEEAP